MVARVQNHPLMVTFTRDGDPPERLYAKDEEHAWAHGIALLSAREDLRHGDTLTVLRIGTSQPGIPADEDEVIVVIRRPGKD